MSAELQLPRVRDLAGDLGPLRDALSEQLFGGRTDRPFSFSVEEDESAHGLPAWTDAGTGAVHATTEVAAALASGDREAALALAHQVVHAIGSGPAFPHLREQLLEEVIAEVVAQVYLVQLVGAFGGAVADPGPLFRSVPSRDDLEVTRLTATSVAIERFARIVAWIEGLDGPATAEEIEAAVLRWAVALKAHPGDQRFAIMAAAAADVDAAEFDDDVDATAWLDDYLGQYLVQRERSDTGFAALRYASARAWGDRGDRPTPQPSSDGEPWRQEIAAVEAVTLDPLPQPGAISAALRAAKAGISATAHRSLDARHLLWGARAVDTARRAGAV
jgi:hypothetical protein